MRKLMENVVLILAFAVCFTLLFWVATDTTSVDAGNLGPTLTFHPMDKEAKAFVKVAQAGYEEESGYLKVAGQWYRVSWYFHDKRVKFIRVLSPPIKTSGGSCSVEYLKGDVDDED